jgi:hypothetical protein
MILKITTILKNILGLIRLYYERGRTFKLELGFYIVF